MPSLLLDGSFVTKDTSVYAARSFDLVVGTLRDNFREWFPDFRISHTLAYLEQLFRKPSLRSFYFLSLMRDSNLYRVNFKRIKLSLITKTYVRIYKKIAGLIILFKLLAVARDFTCVFVHAFARVEFNEKLLILLLLK